MHPGRTEPRVIRGHRAVPAVFPTERIAMHCVRAVIGRPVNRQESGLVERLEGVKRLAALEPRQHGAEGRPQPIRIHPVQPLPHRGVGRHPPDPIPRCQMGLERAASARDPRLSGSQHQSEGYVNGHRATAAIRPSLTVRPRRDCVRCCHPSSTNHRAGPRHPPERPEEFAKKYSQ